MPCTATRTTDCLPQEVAHLNPEDDDEICFGGLRLDKYFGEENVLTVEGGYAELEVRPSRPASAACSSPTSMRDWARVNFTHGPLELLG